MEQPLTYIAAYADREKHAGAGLRPVAINLITNFTDDILERILGGMCMSEGVYPTITKVPYKQYALALCDEGSDVYRSTPNISFFYFDASPYKHSEFLDEQHRSDVLAAIDKYARTVGGHTVVGLFALPYHGAYGHFHHEEPLFRALSDFNQKLRELAAVNPAIHLFDTNRLMSRVGEWAARDPRGHYAFDMPYTSEFLVALSGEWLAYIRAALGLSRKCIVLDLDNTLWGGVVGEDGPLGIALGSEYPGVAYQNFQRALLRLSERGVILAINSKNNEADVREVFEKNPHMILKEEHFAAIRANWDEKSANIRSLAEELNIGLDSMVFIDDSRLERERMRELAPEVLTPDWTLQPEEYSKQLFALNVFHQMSLTEEDKEKGKMYAEERSRKKVEQSSQNLEDYIRTLGIAMNIAVQNEIDLSRAAQLTQKTNQYNLTTRRYSEGDIVAKIDGGALVALGEVSDKFGSYGKVIFAIIDIRGAVATLDTFLMSCRVMGRGVEQAFTEYLMLQLHAQGVTTLEAEFIPTKKNVPAKDFLFAAGFQKTKTVDGVEHYTLAIEPYVRKLTSRTGTPIITVL